MEAFLIYILKSAAFLSIFYFAYLLLLKNDTSFDLNRKFLLTGLFAAIILPSVYFTKKVVVESTSLPIATTNFSEIGIPALEQGINWWMVAGITYLLVLCVLLLRFIFRLYRIMKMIYSLPNHSSGKFIYVHTSEEMSPFSFFNYIVFNPDLHTKEELDLILTHETVHSRQLHSLDILLSNLVSCFLWFNPICGGYKNCIAQNLEYIADSKTVEEIPSKKEYLKTLVKVSIGPLQPALTNSFYKSFIKKRIIMLHKNKTSHSSSWKFAMVFPAILAFMLVFNVQTKVYAQEKTSIISTNLEVFIDFDKTTSREDLEGYTALMAEYDVILKFNNLTYNSEGLLTNITVEFIDKSNVSSGSVTKSNSAGIEPFRYIYNTEEGSRFTTPKAHAPVSPPAGSKNVTMQVFKTSPADSTKSSFTIVGNENNPVYILNGKVIKSSTITAMDPNSFSSVEVLKGASAVSLYGDAAKDGAIVITTKKEGDSIRSKNFTFTTGNRVMVDSLKGNRTYTVNRVRFSDDSIQGRTRVFNGGGEIFYPQDTENKNRRTFILTDTKSLYYDKSLIIVEGEEMPADFNMTSLDQSNIKEIKILKGESAVEKYGEKAKGGVVEITLKKKKK